MSSTGKLTRRILLRMQDADRTAGSMLKLLAVVSMLRTVLCRVVPVCGSATWWTAPLMMLPGLLLSWLLSWLLKRRGVSTLPQLVRSAAGRAGLFLFTASIAILLLADAAASLTVLITMFTEGVGTRGTQLTLAILTCCVLLVCLQKEGMPRGIYLLRHALLLCALLAVGFMANRLSVSNLYPVWGESSAVTHRSIITGFSLGWPLMLPLLHQSADRNRRGLVQPVVIAGITTLLLCLMIPCEVLVGRNGLAHQLLMATRFVPTGIGTLLQCLLMLLLFLATGAAVLVATQQMAAPLGQPPEWLPGAVLLALTLSQAADGAMIWRGCNAALAIALVSSSLLPLVICILRRRRT